MHRGGQRFDPAMLHHNVINLDLSRFLFVKNNVLLNELAHKYGKSITQVIMRWHIQQGVIPIFRSFNSEHIRDNVDVYGFELTDTEMQQIYALNQNYKFHPESLNCPGY